MNLLRFKCKVTGRTFQEEGKDRGVGCSGCAFQCSKVESEDEEVQYALGRHCLGVSCSERQTLFVEVTE